MKRVAVVLLCVAGLMVSLRCVAAEVASAKASSVPAQLTAPLPSWLASQGGQAPISQAIASPRANPPFGPLELSCTVVCASCAPNGEVCCHVTPSLCTCVDPGGTCFPS